MLSLFAGCSEEFAVEVTQRSGQVGFEVTAPEDACPDSLRVMPDADQRSSAWYITNRAAGQACIRRFTYGKVPEGWSVVVAAKPLAAGTTYRVEIEQPSGGGNADFTPAR